MQFDGQKQVANQYQPPQLPSPTKGKSNKTLVILILVLVGGFFLICCGGLGGLTYFGLDIVSSEVENQVRNHPTIKSEIGEIKSFDMSLTKSAHIREDDVFVFDVQGTKGDGEVTAKIFTNSEGMEEIIRASLKTSTGRTMSLIP
ncbi:MAG: hypothetical protein VX776_00375 [Planctomycetota bacterium]|nr:hypothetical protein [Planctomycetota bacterium]MEE2676044.1 hypothetical protein [Planctomycetota bacterium]